MLNVNPKSRASASGGESHKVTRSQVTSALETKGQSYSATQLFEIVESSANGEEKNPYQLEADEGIASLIIMARKAKRENQKLIIGLETNWIPGINVKNSLQKQAMAKTGLMKEIDSIGKALERMGLDNVELVHESVERLADVLIERADKTHTKMHNIVVMASKNTIYSTSFEPLMNADINDKPFLTSIDPTELIKLYEKFGELSDKQLHIKLASLFYMMLEVAAGKEPPEAPWIKYDSVMRIQQLLTQQLTR